MSFGLCSSVLVLLQTSSYFTFMTLFSFEFESTDAIGNLLGVKYFKISFDRFFVVFRLHTLSLSLPYNWLHHHGKADHALLSQKGDSPQYSGPSSAPFSVKIQVSRIMPLFSLAHVKTVLFIVMIGAHGNKTSTFPSSILRYHKM